jgi:hypothetical protein
MEIKVLGIQRIKTGSPRVVSLEIPAVREAEYRALVKKAQPLDRFDLVLSTMRKKRSTGPWSQNHHLNGHAMQIAQETGQSFDDVKLYAKRAAIPWGLPLKLKPNGDIVYSIVDGQPVPISETEMDTAQCGWVIEELHILAAEFGIVLREE